MKDTLYYHVFHHDGPELAAAPAIVAWVNANHAVLVAMCQALPTAHDHMITTIFYTLSRAQDRYEHHRQDNWDHNLPEWNKLTETEKKLWE